MERESLLDQEREASYRQQQEQQVFNDQIIREREEGIKEIERQMIDVHEIFVDLSNLVTEQGLMLGNF